jgi:hypothetical protein
MSILKSLFRHIFFTIKKNIQVLTTKKDDILFRELYRNGFVHIKNVLNLDVLKRIQVEFEDLKKKYPEKDFYSEKISKDSEDIFFQIIKKKNLLPIISSYLGNVVLFYENLYIYAGAPASNDNTWVPHHDTKGNRLKFYFWIISDQNSHPLFYKKRSHKIFKKWSNSDETFYKKLDNSELESILGSPGDLTIFDTHGIHSGKKKITSPRSIVNLTFDPVSKIGLGLNPQSIAGKKEIERLSGRILDIRKI